MTHPQSALPDKGEDVPPHGARIRSAHDAHPDFGAVVLGRTSKLQFRGAPVTRFEQIQRLRQELEAECNQLLPTAREKQDALGHAYVAVIRMAVSDEIRREVAAMMKLLRSESRTAQIRIVFEKLRNDAATPDATTQDSLLSQVENVLSVTFFSSPHPETDYGQTWRSEHLLKHVRIGLSLFASTKSFSLLKEISALIERPDVESVNYSVIAGLERAFADEFPEPDDELGLALERRLIEANTAMHEVENVARSMRELEEITHQFVDAWSAVVPPDHHFVKRVEGLERVLSGEGLQGPWRGWLHPEALSRDMAR